MPRINQLFRFAVMLGASWMFWKALPGLTEAWSGRRDEPSYLFMQILLVSIILIFMYGVAIDTRALDLLRSNN